MSLTAEIIQKVWEKVPSYQITIRRCGERTSVKLGLIEISMETEPLSMDGPLALR